MEIIWKNATDGNIPLDAVVCGRESDGTPLYLCRANLNGGLHIGKVRPEFGAANIPYGGGEHKVKSYEVYCGGGKWVSASGGSIPSGAIVCGNEANGIPLFAARADINGGVHPGKVRKEFGAANIPYDGKEQKVNPYEVLIEG